MSKDKDDKKESKKENLEALMDKDTKELISDFEEKKKELKKERELKNPEDRLTGKELEAIIGTITGFRDGNGNLKTGVGKTKATSLFNTKLISNLLEAQENLQVIEALVPKMSEEEKQRYKNYEDKYLEIAKKNAGIPDTEDVKRITETMIEASGNKEIFDKEIEQLNEEFSDVVDKKEEIEERREELMQTPLVKCDFDMIRRSEIPDNLNAFDIGPLWPMIEKKDK